MEKRSSSKVQTRGLRLLQTHLFQQLSSVQDNCLVVNFQDTSLLLPPAKRGEDTLKRELRTRRTRAAKLCGYFPMSRRNCIPFQLILLAASYDFCNASSKFLPFAVTPKTLPPLVMYFPSESFAVPA